MPASKNRLGRGLGGLIAGGGRAPAAQPATPAPRKAAKPSTSKPGARKPALGKSPATKKVAEQRGVSPRDTQAQMAGRQAPKTSAPEPSDGSFREIAISRIVPNPYQPRREILDEGVAELAESIRSEGLLQPVVVREKGDAFELIAGERRWRACRKLGLKMILARVMTATDSSSAVISMIENLQREGLNPIDEALGYASLIKDFDLTQEAVAERVGKARASIANALRLLQLDEDIRAYVARGLLSTGHAKVLLGVEDRAQRGLLARRIIEARLSVRETEREIRRMNHRRGSTEPGASLPEVESTVIRSLEKQLCSRLNTKVLLRHRAKRGQIIIEYHGNDDLQRILEKTGLS